MTFRMPKGSSPPSFNAPSSSSAPKTDKISHSSYSSSCGGSANATNTKAGPASPATPTASFPNGSSTGNGNGSAVAHGNPAVVLSTPVHAHTSSALTVPNDWNAISPRGQAVLRLIAVPTSLGRLTSDVAEHLRTTNSSVLRHLDELAAEIRRLNR